MAPKRTGKDKPDTVDTCETRAARSLEEVERYWTEQRRADASPLPLERDPEPEGDDS